MVQIPVLRAVVGSPNQGRPEAPEVAAEGEVGENSALPERGSW